MTKFKISAVILSIVALTQMASAENRMCKTVVDDTAISLADSPSFPQDELTLERVEHEIGTSKQVSDFVMNRMRKLSKSIKARHQGGTIELDYLCIGAGHSVQQPHWCSGKHICARW